MEDEIEEKSWWTGFKKNFAELLEFIAIVGAVLVIVRFFIAEPHRVYGSSMVPNFHDSDYIITNKTSETFKIGTIERGEVIILKNPKNTKEDFIKRVVGLPGEKVSLRNGSVYINNNLLIEPYLPEGLDTLGESFLHTNQDYIVPADNYFVMGDNRINSSDSREWGPVSKDLIVGQAWLRYWPINKFTLIKPEQPSN